MISCICGKAFCWGERRERMWGGGGAGEGFKVIKNSPGGPKKKKKSGYSLGRKKELQKTRDEELF